MVSFWSVLRHSARARLSARGSATRERCPEGVRREARNGNAALTTLVPPVDDYRCTAMARAFSRSYVITPCSPPQFQQADHCTSSRVVRM